MIVVVLVLWYLGILLTAGAAVLSAIAVRARRPRLALAGIVPVGVLLVAGAFGEITAPHPLFAATLGLALAVIGVVGGDSLVTLVLTLSSRDETRLGAHGGILVRDVSAPAPAQREVLRGGTVIGYLERFAVIGAVIVGQAGAVALIVAVKGLGRFSELENERVRERFIIGTLASLIWAGVCAFAILAVT